MLTLVTGGARSGKSGFAEKLVMHESKNGEAFYIATAQAFDDEMRERIGHHRQIRDASAFGWRTLEEPQELSALLRRLGEEGGGAAVLVDCLTLWLSNRLLALEHDPRREERLQEEIEALVQSASPFPTALTLVTNEVGGGLVPEYALGRLFRDWAGRLNQRLAERAERVFLVTCGIPVELKSLQYRFK